MSFHDIGGIGVVLVFIAGSITIAIGFFFVLETMLGWNAPLRRVFRPVVAAPLTFLLLLGFLKLTLWTPAAATWELVSALLVVGFVLGQSHNRWEPLYMSKVTRLLTVMAGGRLLEGFMAWIVVSDQIALLPISSFLTNQTLWLQVSQDLCLLAPPVLGGLASVAMVMFTARARASFAIWELEQNIDNDSSCAVKGFISWDDMIKFATVNESAHHASLKTAVNDYVDLARYLYRKHSYGECSALCQRMTEVLAHVKPALVNAAVGQSFMENSTKSWDDTWFLVGLSRGVQEAIEYMHVGQDERAIDTADQVIKVFNARFRTSTPAMSGGLPKLRLSPC